MAQGVRPEWVHLAMDMCFCFCGLASEMGSFRIFRFQGSPGCRGEWDFRGCPTRMCSMQRGAIAKAPQSGGEKEASLFRGEGGEPGERTERRGE